MRNPFILLTKKRLANSNAGKTKCADADTVNGQDQEFIYFGHANVGVHSLLNYRFNAFLRKNIKQVTEKYEKIK